MTANIQDLLRMLKYLLLSLPWVNQNYISILGEIQCNIFIQHGFHKSHLKIEVVNFCNTNTHSTSIDKNHIKMTMQHLHWSCLTPLRIEPYLHKSNGNCITHSHKSSRLCMSLLIIILLLFFINKKKQITFVTGFQLKFFLISLSNNL